MIIADTNILLRAALDDDMKQSHLARQRLATAEKIAVSLQTACEFAWVLSRRYKLDDADIVASLLNLVDDERVYCNRDAVYAGLAFLEAGGDFADGVIEFEGRKLGGTVFVTFDRKAASTIRSKGRECILLDLD